MNNSDTFCSFLIDSISGESYNITGRWTVFFRIILLRRPPPMILSIDLGTTSWKAALIAQSGEIVRVARIPTPAVTENGAPCYSADLSEPLGRLLGGLPPDRLRRVRLVALTGMAEAGLLAERETMKPLSTIRPWFDRTAIPLYEATRSDPRFAGRPAVTGLPDHPKYGIYKLLTLLRESGRDPASVLWCDLVSWAAALLTGSCSTDFSLASRTGCLNLRTLQWDLPFLASLGLDAAGFPSLTAQGGAAGTLRAGLFGLPAGIPVCIGGHDHICAASASGAFRRGNVFLSAGTAQVLLTQVPSFDPSTGLSYGPSPADGQYTCLGSVQSAGGSVKFWKEKLYPSEGYEVLLREASAAPVPSGLLYFPYLAGSGVPHPDPAACGALLGLRDNTARGAVLAGVYEGIALETRFLAEAMGSPPGCGVSCMGGLTRHPRYLQTLADVLGEELLLPASEEGTLYGAARLAAERLGFCSLPDIPVRGRCRPDPHAHDFWNGVYRSRYIPLLNIFGSEEWFHGIPAGSQSTD